MHAPEIAATAGTGVLVLLAACAILGWLRCAGKLASARRTLRELGITLAWCERCQSGRHAECLGYRSAGPCSCPFPHYRHHPAGR